jgi:hypothetical protein
MKIYHENSDYVVSVEYPEPINSLQRLTVRWFDANGNLLDFKGYFNHAFILKLHVLENDVRRLPPPPPLQDVEIKENRGGNDNGASTTPEEKRKRVPWVLIFSTYWCFCCMEDTCSTSSDGVDWVAWVIDLDIERKSLDCEEDDNCQEGREQGAQNVVLATVLADLNNLGDDETNNVHPRDGTGKGKTGDDRVQGLCLQLKSNT